MLKKIFRIIFIFLVLLLVLGVSFFTYIDTTPYKKQNFYVETKNNLAYLQKNYLYESGDSIRVSWAKKSLIPSFSVPMSGFSYRKGKHFEGIADSLWVRTFVFDDGKQKIVLLTADLLIFPPLVRENLKIELKKIGFSIEQIFLSSTHTHCGIGAWGQGFAGEQIAGEFDEKIIDFMSQQILAAIQEADLSLESAKIVYGQSNARKLIKNRLVEEKGEVDSLFRWISIEKASGKKAIFCTFAAHATCRGADFMKLSGDYPNLLVKYLEQKFDFAAYSAGAVASQSCGGGEMSSEERLVFVAKNLADSYQEHQGEHLRKMQIFHLPLALGEPQLRIHPKIRLRPFWFEKLIGKADVYLSFLRLGDIVLVGTPCDFSGELVKNITHKNLKVIPTSFNGGYVGYITADHWYDLESYETLTMNWYGKNGDYFVEIINEVLSIMGE